MVKKKCKSFTLPQAHALLPTLEKRLKQLRDKKEAYTRTHDQLFMDELVCAAELSQGFPDRTDDLEAGIHELEDAIEDLAKDVEAIFATGCILRDIEKGHVEFFGSHAGKKVFFSWQLGEPCVGHYRPLGKKIHERVPLPRKAAIKKAK